MAKITVNISDKQLKYLKQLAKRTGNPYSAIVRIAIYEYLDRNLKRR